MNTRCSLTRMHTDIYGPRFRFLTEDPSRVRAKEQRLRSAAIVTADDEGYRR
jgi:hypothetical protein